MKKPTKGLKTALPKRGERTPAKVTIHKLATGVAGLDDIVGGGIPEFSMNLLGGTPGCGKTTMVHQFAFANGVASRFERVIHLDHGELVISPARTEANS